MVASEQLGGRLVGATRRGLAVEQLGGRAEERLGGRYGLPTPEGRRRVHTSRARRTEGRTD